MSNSHSITPKTCKRLFLKVRLSVTIQIVQLLAPIDANAIMAASNVYHQKFMNPHQVPLSVQCSWPEWPWSPLPIQCDGLADVGGAG